MEKTCLWCNQVYKTSHRNQKYCNPKCQAKAMSRDRKGQHSSLSTEFKKGNIPQYPIKKNEHRSRATEFKKGHNWSLDIRKKMLENIRIAAEKKTDPENRPITTCPICHKSFFDFKSNKRKFCSRNCYEISKRDSIPWNKDKKGVMPVPWNKGLKGVVKFSEESRKKQSDSLTGIKRSLETRMKISAARTDGVFKGFQSFEPYSSDFNKELKELIRLRDGYKCQRCGCPEIEEGKCLTIHHIDYDKKNSRPSNLITLCSKCNTQVNFNRPHWQRIFHRKIQKLMSNHPLQLNFRVTKFHDKNRSQGRLSQVKQRRSSHVKC